MGAKFKFKTHLPYMFFDFWAVFCAFGCKVWKKYKYDLQNFFLQKKIKKISKNAEFHADFKSVEKVQKNSEKNYKQNKFEEHE